MPTASITQQRPVSDSLVSRPVRTNPWQRTVAIITLVPALIGTGVFVAALLNHKNDGTAAVELSGAISAFVVAGSLALLWVLIGAINWQIKEATRSRG
jgi:Ni,Fe-hydrogenase I cytochrome b subunit